MDYQIMLTELLKGLLVSVEIFVLTLVFSLPLGLIIALGRMSGNCIIRNIFRVYISIMRGTPLMLQLLVCFFGPYYIFNVHLSSEYRFIAVILAFSLNYAAYFAEIYRGGIEAVPKGQTEAGQVLGMTRMQIFFKVTLLQVVKRILPPMGNEIITLVKDTSLANTIANKEIIMMAKEYSAKGLIWPLFSTALFFLVFVGALTLLFNWAEKKLDYFRC